MCRHRLCHTWKIQHQLARRLSFWLLDSSISDRTRLDIVSAYNLLEALAPLHTDRTEGMLWDIQLGHPSTIAIHDRIVAATNKNRDVPC